MAQGFSAELVGVLDATLNPPAKRDGRVANARLRCHRATLDLAAATTKIANGDTNVLARVSRGQRVVAILMTSSVDLGAAATVAIGNATTAAKYKAAAVFRNADTPTWYMLAAAEDDIPLADAEDILMTIGAANLPGAGIVVFEILTSGR